MSTDQQGTDQQGPARRSSAAAGWMNTRETAEYIGIATQTLRVWRMRKYGPPASKIGGVLRYDRSEVDAWIADQHE